MNNVGWFAVVCMIPTISCAMDSNQLIQTILMAHVAMQQAVEVPEGASSDADTQAMWQDQKHMVDAQKKKAPKSKPRKQYQPRRPRYGVDRTMKK